MKTTTPRSGPLPPPADLLDVAVTAAHQAAEYLRSLDRDDIGRQYKTSNHDIVTEHDRACEEIIVEVLRSRVPQARIVGEEGGERSGDDDGSEGDTHDEVTFFVDPVDGTSNFAAGLPLFCISIGVAVGRELVAGVIDAPVLGQVFTAADGPAMLNGVPLRPRPTHQPQDALLLTGFPTQRSFRENAKLASEAAEQLHLSHSAVRHLGSAALELAYIAAGWGDAAGLATINAWDVAAGFHLVRRAGGSLRTWPGTGSQSAPEHERPAYVACTGQDRLPVFDQVMERVQQQRTASWRPGRRRPC